MGLYRIFKNVALCFLVLVLGAVVCVAETSSKIVATIPWGTEERAAGNLQTGESFAGPVLFDVSLDGSIYIPDLYKARIIVLARNGDWQKTIACPSLTPRLRAFRVGAQALYMINDQTLSAVDLTGKVISTFSLGFSLPDFMWTAGQVYLVFKEMAGGKSILLSPELANSQELFLQSPSGAVAVFRDKWSRLWASTAGDYAKLKPQDWKIPDSAQFVQSNSTGGSLWTIQPNRGSQTFYFVDSKTGGSETAAISWNSEHPGSGFCTAADETFSIYKLLLSKKGLTIVQYQLQKQ